jgi:hypothetical protein
MSFLPFGGEPWSHRQSAEIGTRRRLGRMDQRDERIAKNETVFRAANREIEQADREGGAGPDQLIEVLCECGRQGCGGVITLTLADYEGVHSQADRFVVLQGHESPEIEKVVEERAGYLVVDKFGEAENIAENA